MNFLELCERNRDYLSAGFDDLISTAADPVRTTLLSFADFISANGRLGVNMRPEVLRDFLLTDRWLNIHEWARKISLRGGKTIDELLRMKLKGYFERRMAFDSFFESGLEFRYGALNVGGLGANRFGEYCAIFEQAAVARCGLGYLKGDSLNHYVSPGPKVDEDRLRTECASESSKHMLLTIKHASTVPTNSPAQWADMACNADCYAEAILVQGDLKAGHLHRVRIARLDFDLYWEYAFLEFSERLSELDRYRVDAFAAIDERLQALGVSWDTV